MNNFKQELIKSVGDLKVSKERVIKGVEQRRQAQRKKMPKFIPAIATAFVVFVIGVFAFRLISQETVQGLEPDDILAMYQAEYEVMGHSVSTAINNAQLTYASNIQMLAYGAKYNMNVTDEQKQENADRYLDSFPDKMRTALEENLKEKSYSIQDYERFVTEHIGQVNQIIKQLLVKYTTEYPGFSENILRELILLDAYDYFEETHHEQLAALNKEFGSILVPPNGGVTRGVVIAVEDQAFLFAPGFIGEYSEEDRQTLENQGDQFEWIPIREGWDAIAVGDCVKLNITSSYWSDSEKNRYNPAAISLSLEHITDEMIQFKVSSAKGMAQWQKTMDWTTQKIEMNTDPFYRFHVGEASYDAWLTADKQWLELYEPTMHQYAKVRVDKLAMWMERVSP